MYAVTIDSGTTNTRVSVWKDNDIIAESFRSVGVRDTAITGSKETLMQGVKEAIDEAIVLAGIKDRNSVTFIASGMITSNVGLYEVPHLLAPAGLKEFSEGMVKAELPEVSDQPIWFIPGVKNNVPNVTVDNCESMDVIRGEEVEVVGILQKLQLKGSAILILPGSHSKIISIDEKKRITGVVTSIAGELMDVITQKTILANALQNSFATEINETMVLKGAGYAEKVGLGRTCFSVRILDLFDGSLSLNDKANFLMGAVLGGDILAVKHSTALVVSSDMPVIIFGKKMLRDALAVLVKNDPFFAGSLNVMGDEYKSLAGFGALTIARERGILK
ncbi:MAG: 2-dehydro-3-deoxygalactonokinase [Firmicutes bacterium]|nr:2-dehydro-3-deoxygalactonokinase [Bacillota bacterium]